MKRSRVRTHRLVRFLDNSLLPCLSLFLLIFIPLYPKIPLADVLPGYIVRLRLEDVFVAFTALVYVVWWIRGKVDPKRNPLWLLVVLYLLIGLLSGFSAVFFTKTIPMEFLHIAKWGFHWLRRVEYLFLLFLLFDSVKSIKQLRIIIGVLGLIVVVVTAYGFGQKYRQWPVYSTMNREFAKGWRLVLTEHARVPSTFAGHYDLAAYLVFLLPILLSATLVAPLRWERFLAMTAFVSGYVLLILTASRASFISYVVSVILLFGYFLTVKPRRYVVLRFAIVFAFSAVIFLTFGDLSGRFAHLVNLSGVRGYIENDILHLQRRSARQYLALTDQLALVADRTDTPPVRFPPKGTVSLPGATEESKSEASTSALPPDVYENIPLPISSFSGESGAATLSYKPRSYSDAAFAYGLSSAIRFDALWPRAIAGFKRNPLLGSGFSTLTKEQVTDFTEAESTDNDYLRSLGETGLLGFATFFGIIGYAIVLLWNGQRAATSVYTKVMLVATSVATVALLINASYIDVFEASKVAFTFWSLLGVMLIVATKHQYSS